MVVTSYALENDQIIFVVEVSDEVRVGAQLGDKYVHVEGTASRTEERET